MTIDWRRYGLSRCILKTFTDITSRNIVQVWLKNCLFQTCATKERGGGHDVSWIITFLLILFIFKTLRSSFGTQVRLEEHKRKKELENILDSHIDALRQSSGSTHDLFNNILRS